MLNKIIFLFLIGFLVSLSSLSFAMEFTVSDDFDHIAGMKGALHTIRVHALENGATKVKLLIPGDEKSRNVQLSAQGEYAEWNLPVITKIITDKAVFVTRYDAARYFWNEPCAGTGK